MSSSHMPVPSHYQLEKQPELFPVPDSESFTLFPRHLLLKSFDRNPTRKDGVTELHHLLVCTLRNQPGFQPCDIAFEFYRKDRRWLRSQSDQASREKEETCPFYIHLHILGRPHIRGDPQFIYRRNQCA